MTSRVVLLLTLMHTSVGWAPLHRALNALSPRRLQRAYSSPDPPPSAPEHTGREVGALHIRGVPTTTVLKWLANDWAHTVPRHRTAMPLETTATATGLCLRFVACPTDAITVVVSPVVPATEGCLVTLKRGEGGKASIGALGPQVASLVQAAERETRDRLERDLRSAFPTTAWIAVSPRPPEPPPVDPAALTDDVALALGARALAAQGAAAAAGSRPALDLATLGLAEGDLDDADDGFK